MPRQLKAAGAGRSGRSTLARDSEDILNQAVDNFYAMQRVRRIMAEYAVNKPANTRMVQKLMLCEDTIKQIEDALT